MRRFRVRNARRTSRPAELVQPYVGNRFRGICPEPTIPGHVGRAGPDARQRKTPWRRFPFPFDENLDHRSRLADEQFLRFGQRHPVGGCRADLEDHVPGPDAAAIGRRVPIGCQDRQAPAPSSDRDAYPTQVALLQQPRVHDVDLIVEAGIGIELGQHGLDARPHEGRGAHVVHIPGGELFIEGAKDLEVLAQLEQVIILSEGRADRDQDQQGKEKESSRAEATHGGGQEYIRGT